VPKLRKVSGKKVIGILCNKLGFEISGRSSSHVRLSKITPKGKEHVLLKIAEGSGAMKSLWQS